MENVQTSVTNPEKPIRPTLLTVLCILTFIGSGWGLIGSISNYMNADLTSSIVEETMNSAKTEVEREISEGDDGAKVADKMLSGMSSITNPENIKKNALFSIVANLLTLGGAIMMFRLRKTGFWLYLAGTIIAIAAPIMVYGAANLLSLGMSAILGFFGILFLVLYSLNLKYMR